MINPAHESREPSGPVATFDPTSPASIEDPYPGYASLRATSPVTRWAGSSDVWMVSRYADVMEAFAHPSARVRPVGEPVPPAYVGGPAEMMWRHNMALLDEPDHTRVRRTVARPLGPAAVEAMRAMVTSVVDETVSAALARGTVDAVEHLAKPIPMRVVSALLGLPESDWERLASWTPDFLRIFLPDANGPDDVVRVHRACGNFIDYFGELVEQRRARPADDLTTVLVRAHDAGALSYGELVATLRGVLTAGFETTMSTIASFVLCAARSPEVLRQLRDQPALIPVAVEEILRWESPVQAIMRSFAEPVRIGSVEIPVGHKAWLLVGSANHDDTVYPAPQEFRLDRPEVPHHAFGGGRHRCAGAALARLELEITITAVAQRLERVEAHDGPVVRRANFQFRAIERLPVVLAASGAL